MLKTNKRLLPSIKNPFPILVDMIIAKIEKFEKQDMTKYKQKMVGFIQF